LSKNTLREDHNDMGSTSAARPIRRRRRQLISQPSSPLVTDDDQEDEWAPGRGWHTLHSTPVYLM